MRGSIGAGYYRCGDLSVRGTTDAGIYRCGKKAFQHQCLSCCLCWAVTETIPFLFALATASVQTHPKTDCCWRDLAWRTHLPTLLLICACLKLITSCFRVPQ
ncbi:hypothetical protein ACOMHN_038671 [Nucella lapillus]